MSPGGGGQLPGLLISAPAEISVVPLLLESWNTLMPYLAHLAEVYDLIGA